jgi:integrase
MTNDPQKIAVLDGKLHIFRRPNSRFWWCGFHSQGQYVRASTKSEELKEATEAAKRWFYKEQGKIEVGGGRVPARQTFAYFAQKAAEDYEHLAKNGQGSERYAKNLRLLLENDLVKFFGRYPLKSVNQQLWHQYYNERLKPQNPTTSTIKHHLNGIRIVFRRARLRGEISETPVFATERKSAGEVTPRTWFQPQEYIDLYTATRANITKMKDTRWHEDAKELHDYVLFVANSGLRVGEARNIRFCDIEYDTDKNRMGEIKPVLIIRNIKGKRGTGSAKTYFGAVRPFERIVERRKLKDNWRTSTDLIFKHHHRDMFNTILSETKLKLTADRPPKRRDLMSLRHTYICFRLMNGAGIYDIAANCRTSVAMIENHYARWLTPIMANLNTAPLQHFGNEDDNMPPSDDSQSSDASSVTANKKRKRN